MTIETKTNFTNQLEQFSNLNQEENSQNEPGQLPPPVESGLETGCFDFMQQNPDVALREGRRLRFQELQKKLNND